MKGDYLRKLFTWVWFYEFTQGAHIQKKVGLEADDFRAIVNWFPCRGITISKKVGYHNIRVEGEKNNPAIRLSIFFLVLKKLWWTQIDKLTVSLSKMSRWLRVTIFLICSKITLPIAVLLMLPWNFWTSNYRNYKTMKLPNQIDHFVNLVDASSTNG